MRCPRKNDKIMSISGMLKGFAFPNREIPGRELEAARGRDEHPAGFEAGPHGNVQEGGRLLGKTVAVVMGSDSDFPVVEKAIKQLRALGIPAEWRILSAHRTPEEACAFARDAEKRGVGVIIAAAGKAAALAGVLAAHTVLPVIGIPLRSAALDGLDALLSTVQMPPGVPLATVGIDSAQNAAILAAQILAVSDAALRDRLISQRGEMRAAVLEKDAVLQEKLETI